MTLTCEAFLLNAGEIHPPSLLLQIKHVMIIVAFVSLFLGLLVCFEKNFILDDGTAGLRPICHQVIHIIILIIVSVLIIKIQPSS